ncbi:50S ribosomal protein L7/L12 [Nymphaea thermarum]|nr:50S ribosomal protein L7/L12 [Nymphaea thermarum]
MNRINAARALLSSAAASSWRVRLLTTRSNFPDAKTYKPKRYKLPPFYDPYGPRPPPSDKVLRLAERIASLSPEELEQFGPCLSERIRAPRLQHVSGSEAAAAAGGMAASSAGEEKKAAVEKTAFDVKLEKFDAAAKIKVIKEVRAFTNLGLKEAKELVEKAPVVLKQGVSKEEANDILEKIKSAGGVAVME